MLTFIFDGGSIRRMDIRKAILQAKHTQASLARELKVSTQVVNNWLRRGKVPLDRVEEVEKIIGVDRRLLCPDFPWPPDQKLRRNVAA